MSNYSQLTRWQPYKEENGPHGFNYVLPDYRFERLVKEFRSAEIECDRLKDRLGNAFEQGQVIAQIIIESGDVLPDPIRSALADQMAKLQMHLNMEE